MLPTKEMPKTDGREHKSRHARMAYPSVWPIGQSLLSSWLKSWCHPTCQRVRTALPGKAFVASCDKPRLCLRKEHRPLLNAASAAPSVGFYLQPTPRLSCITLLTQTTHRLPTGDDSPSCVSQILCSKS